MWLAYFIRIGRAAIGNTNFHTEIDTAALCYQSAQKRNGNELLMN